MIGLVEPQCEAEPWLPDPTTHHTRFNPWRPSQGVVLELAEAGEGVVPDEGFVELA